MPITVLRQISGLSWYSVPHQRHAVAAALRQNASIPAKGVGVALELALAREVLDFVTPMNAPTNLDYGPNHSSAQVVDSVVALVRAELRLLWFRARRVGGRTAVAIGLTWVSMSLTHIALFVLIVLPILSATYSELTIAATIVPATLLSVITWIMSIRSWRKVFEDKGEDPKTTEAQLLDLERSNH